ncbi:MAG TPA: antibiotic biosynthesis monooxygenase [Thermoplasmata archaeon]|jgi:heme-degrading monooxygenase HmoA
MIARTWRGRTPTEKATAYHEYLEESGIAEYRRTKGNRGVYVLQRRQGEVTEFFLLSLWDSMDSLREFAGEDVSKARYFPKDREFLLEFESTVDHYEVLSAP